MNYFKENHDSECFIIKQEVLTEVIKILRKIKIFRRHKEYIKNNLVLSQSEKIRKFLCEEITMIRLLGIGDGFSSSESEDWSDTQDNNEESKSKESVIPIPFQIMEANRNKRASKILNLPGQYFNTSNEKKP